MLDPSDPNFPHLDKLCLSLQLRDIVQEPTRITNTSSKCLDVILTNTNFLPKATVKDIDISDHALVQTSAIIHKVKDKSIAPGNCKRRLKRNWRVEPGSLEQALSLHMATFSADGAHNIWEEWRDKFLAS